MCVCMCVCERERERARPTIGAAKGRIGCLHLKHLSLREMCFHDRLSQTQRGRGSFSGIYYEFQNV
jgi:hypothetical protein